MSTINIVDWINSLSESELKDQLVLTVDGQTPTKGNSADKVSLSDIVDDLNSTDVDKPLSANQGKQLNDDKASLSALGTMSEQDADDVDIMGGSGVFNSLINSRRILQDQSSADSSETYRINFKRVGGNRRAPYLIFFGMMGSGPTDSHVIRLLIYAPLLDTGGNLFSVFSSTARTDVIGNMTASISSENDKQVIIEKTIGSSSFFTSPVIHVIGGSQSISITKD